MLAISRALMARPELMLLDEPSLGLSPKLVKDIFEIVVRINRERGVTILLVEQNANMALQTRGLRLRAGGRPHRHGRHLRSGCCEKEDIKEFYLGIKEAGRARRAALEEAEDLAVSEHARNAQGRLARMAWL